MDDIRVYNRPLDADAAAILAMPVDGNPFLVGDVDLSGAVDFLDIGPFISILSNQGFQDEADVDRSGVVDFLDIGPFIQLLAM